MVQNRFGFISRASLLSRCSIHRFNIRSCRARTFRSAAFAGYCGESAVPPKLLQPLLMKRKESRNSETLLSFIASCHQLRQLKNVIFVLFPPPLKPASVCLCSFSAAASPKITFHFIMYSLFALF